MKIETDYYKIDNELYSMFAIHENPAGLLRLFWNSKSDACPLESELQEKQQADFKKFVESKCFRIGAFYDISKIDNLIIKLTNDGFCIFETSIHGGEPHFIKKVNTLDEVDEVVKGLT